MEGNHRDPREREARERVQFYLALVSTLLWFVVTFSLAVALDLPRSAGAGRVIMLGFATLLVAALPWLGYERLVQLAVRRQRQR